MTPQMSRRIRERWDELCPQVTIWARKYSLQPDLEIEQHRERHEQRTLDMLGRGIRLRTIRRYDLDNPMYSDDTFARLTQQAVKNLRKSPPRPREGLAKFTSKRLVSSPSKGDTE